MASFFAGGPSFPLRHRLLRAAWRCCWLLLAAWTPPPLFGWRRLVLGAFGARLAPSARVHASARIWYPPNLEMGPESLMGPRVDCYCMGPVSIGSRAVISQGASFCGGTHDVDDPAFPIVSKPIVIADNAWIAAEAFVGPGVTVRQGAVARRTGCRFQRPRGVDHLCRQSSARLAPPEAGRGDWTTSPLTSGVAVSRGFAIAAR